MKKVFSEYSFFPALVLGAISLFLYSELKKEKAKNKLTFDLVKKGELEYHPKQ